MEENNQYCANCGTSLQGDFCHNCGQKVMKGRFSLKALSGAFVKKILDLDSGFLYTAKAFLLGPGKACREYLNGAQVKYSKPMQFFFLTTAMIFIAFSLTKADKEFAESFKEGMNFGANGAGHELSPAVTEYLQQAFFWIQDIRLFIIASIPATALMFSLMFRKAKLNLAEHSIFLLFMTGVSNLITLPFFVLGNLVNPFIASISSIFSFIYTVWASRQFYQSSWIRSIIAYCLATLLYFILICLAFFAFAAILIINNPELFKK